MSTNYLYQIFERQEALLEKFHTIELKNLPYTFVPSGPTYAFRPEDFRSYAGQRRLRELLWRVFEESTEALQAFQSKSQTVKEELSDTFHFLVEFYLVIGYFPGRAFHATFPYAEEDSDTDELVACFAMVEPVIGLDPVVDLFQSMMVDFLIQVGMLANSLKNRPWKKTRVPLDLTQFHSEAAQLLIGFVRVCSQYGMSAESLYNAYMHKAEVNQIRIDEGV